MPRSWLFGTFEAEFTAASTDGFNFNVRADGRWLRRAIRQHDPRSAAVSYVIGEVNHLAETRSVLENAALEHKANARLGRAVNISGLGVRVQWAQVHVDADQEVQHEAMNRMRLRVRARSDSEDRQRLISQAVALRDLLREDPTLALAHLLLVSPEKITDQAAIGAISKIGEQIAMYAPGAAWIRTAQLLENFFEELPLDAKKFIIDRICTTLTEFGAKEAAQHVMRLHGLDIPNSASYELRDAPGNQ